MTARRHDLRITSTLRPRQRSRSTVAVVTLLLLGLALPHAGAAQATPAGAASEQAAVMTVIRSLFDGMRAGDSTMVRAVFDPRARMISVSQRNGRTIVNVESSADNFAKAVGTPHPEVWDERIRNEKVQIDGPLASVWVDYAFFAGSRFSHCGIDHFLLTKTDAGAWKVLELSDTRRTTGCDDWQK